ncbi:MAG: hypothetical protein R6X32_03860 [Chloroflexota bacterium]|jgi:hypothetical protein
MTKQKWLVVFLVLAGALLLSSLLIQTVGREMSRFISYLFLWTFYIGLLLVHYSRQRRIRTCRVLLKINEPSSSTASTIILAIILTFVLIGDIFEDLFLLRKIDLLEGLRAVSLIAFGWIWVLIGRQEKTVFAEEGIFLGFFFTRWPDIRSYRWQNNRLDLHTNSFFSPHQIELEPDKITAVRMLLENAPRRTSK